MHVRMMLKTLRHHVYAKVSNCKFGRSSVGSLGHVISQRATCWELLALVHALKALRPYLHDKPFELHTDNASLHWLEQKRHVSHH